MFQLYPVMGHFVNIRKQKKVGMTIRIYRDMWWKPGPPTEVSQLGFSGMSEGKVEGVLLPKLDTITNGLGGNVILQDRSQVGKLHACNNAQNKEGFGLYRSLLFVAITKLIHLGSVHFGCVCRCHRSIYRRHGSILSCLRFRTTAATRCKRKCKTADHCQCDYFFHSLQVLGIRTQK